MGETRNDPDESPKTVRELVVTAVARKIAAESCALALGLEGNRVYIDIDGWCFGIRVFEHDAALHFRVSAITSPVGRAVTLDDWEDMGEILGEIADVSGYPDECGMPDPIVPFDEFDPSYAIFWDWHVDGSPVDPAALELMAEVLREQQQKVLDEIRPFISEPKVGRNDLCACGSGKKFKKCHGSN